MAIPLKTIARWLPENFQYFGIWTCLSYALQAVFGYVLVGHVSSRRSTRVLGALFLLIFPPLLKRHTHVALASHWILLAALAAYFRLATKTFRMRLVTWIALVWLASVVHPYLTVMVLGLATAAWVRTAGAHHGRDRWSSLVVPLGLLGLVALSFMAVGHLVYAGDPHPGAGGYGIYSLNLNAVFNPMHTSHFLKTLPWINSAQAEGMNYAGVGMLVLGFVALACVLARPRNYGVVLRHWPLVTVLMVFTVFSWSNQVSWGDRVLLEYPLLKAVNPLVASLRASGRFFWPVLYTGMLGVIWVLAREMPRRISTVLISCGFLLQVADLNRSFDVSEMVERTYTSRLQHPSWDLAASQVDSMIFYQPFRHSFARKADFKHFGWLGARHELPVTTGYAARLPARATRDYEEQLAERLESGNLSPRSLYVLRMADFPRYYAVARERGWSADRWDGYFVLVPPGLDIPVSEAYGAVSIMTLGEYVTRQADEVLLIVVKDDAQDSLSENDKAALRGLGCRIDALDYRASYVAIIADGRLQFERVRTDGAIDVTFPAGEPIADWTPPRTIHLHSAGYPHGNPAVVEIDGVRAGFTGRGFNVVRLDGEGRPVAIGNFDTHIGKPGGVIEYHADP
jgi:hypothetical protein